TPRLIQQANTPIAAVPIAWAAPTAGPEFALLHSGFIFTRRCSPWYRTRARWRFRRARSNASCRSVRCGRRRASGSRGPRSEALPSPEEFALEGRRLRLLPNDVHLHSGDIMKRTLLTVALATAFLVAAGTTAFASHRVTRANHAAARVAANGICDPS